MNKKEKKLFMQGFYAGKKKAKILVEEKIVTKPTILWKESIEEKEWRKTINLFAWIGIISILALGWALIVVFDQQYIIKDKDYWLDHNANTYDTLMTACDNAYKELVVDYKACKAANEGRPIITDFNVSIYRCGGYNESQNNN